MYIFAIELLELDYIRITPLPRVNEGVIEIDICRFLI